MAVAGGLELHRGQLTFDYIDLGTRRVLARADLARQQGEPSGVAAPVRGDTGGGLRGRGVHHGRALTSTHIQGRCCAPLLYTT